MSSLRPYSIFHIFYGWILGIGATRLIRSIEAARHKDDVDTLAGSDGEYTTWPASHRAKIFAVSGLATNDDKIRAFVAGVDG